MPEITLTTSIHKACASEANLYDEHAVRVLPVPGTQGQAVAIATDGRIVAVSPARSDTIAMIPCKSMPSSVKEDFKIDVRGQVDDIIVGRIQNADKKGVLAFERVGTVKLAQAVDALDACAKCIADPMTDGVLVTIDAAELLQLAKAIAAPSVTTHRVSLFVRAGQPTAVIGSGGIGLLVKEETDGDPARTFRALAASAQKAHEVAESALESERMARDLARDGKAQFKDGAGTVEIVGGKKPRSRNLKKGGKR